MTKPLDQILREKCTFEVQPSLTLQMAAPNVSVESRVHLQERMAENARVQPILTAMIECVSALEQIDNLIHQISAAQPFVGFRPVSTRALAKLRETLKQVEALDNE